MDAFISGGWRTPKRGEVLLGGAWRRITRGEVFRAGQWRTCLSFIGPLSLNVTPFVQGFAVGSRFRPETVTTEKAVATPTGGAAPYRYSWSASGVTILSQTMASTAFSASVGPGQTISGVATVTCTDSFGSTAVGQTEYYLYNESNQ